MKYNKLKFYIGIFYDTDHSQYKFISRNGDSFWKNYLDNNEVPFNMRLVHMSEISTESKYSIKYKHYKNAFFDLSKKQKHEEDAVSYLIRGLSNVNIASQGGYDEV